MEELDSEHETLLSEVVHILLRAGANAEGGGWCADDRGVLKHPCRQKTHPSIDVSTHVRSTFVDGQRIIFIDGDLWMSIDGLPSNGPFSELALALKDFLQKDLGM